LAVELTITPAASQAEAKGQFVSQLGAAGVVAIGNGRNDRTMLGGLLIGG